MVAGGSGGAPSDSPDSTRPTRRSGGTTDSSSSPLLSEAEADRSDDDRPSERPDPDPDADPDPDLDLDPDAPEWERSSHDILLKGAQGVTLGGHARAWVCACAWLTESVRRGPLL
jgi:hypothetical protein